MRVLHGLHAITVVFRNIDWCLLHLILSICEPLDLGKIGPSAISLAIAVVGVDSRYVGPWVFGGFYDALALAGAVLNHQLLESHLLLV